MRKITIIFLVLSLGCASLQSSKIQSAAGNAEMVVFDIDGTLTPRPVEIWKARDGAADAVMTNATKGYQIVYLSARPPGLQSGIPEWLKKNGFPNGYIFVPETIRESNDPTEFKVKILKQIIAHGWHIIAAYGDSSTDFAAYSEVGIPKANVYAIKRKGADECQAGNWSKCMTGWKE